MIAKNRTIQKFETIARKIDEEIPIAVKIEDTGKKYKILSSLNKKNQAIYNDASKDQNSYDLETFNLDAKNTNKIIDGIQKCVVSTMDKSCPFKWEKVAKCIDGLDHEKTKIAWIKASHKMSLFTRPIFKGFAHTNQLFDSKFANEKKKVSRTRNQKAKQELIALADAEAENHASLENDYDQNDGQMGT